ncbi:MAG: MBL fold metallo-hydrolase, partial [Gemmatimonadetes bacterium]|nr:MBL fold metallo-hydrolase [Gemmatimonadota bacterium]
MEIQTFTGPGFGENAYLAVCEESGSGVAIDPGSGATALCRAVEVDGLTLEAIFLTHAHLDHIEGVSTVREQHPEVPIWLHPDDLPLYEGAPQQA